MTVDAEFGAPPVGDREPLPSETREELGVTTLDSLRAVVEEQVVQAPIEINVPNRKNMSVRFSRDLEEPLFRAWQRQTKDRSSPSGYDDLKLSCIVLSNQAEAIIVGDQVVLDENGREARFTSAAVISLFADSAARAGRDPVKDGAAAVRECYANDGHLLAVAQEVIRECGYGEEVAANAPDPTRGRSRR